MSVLELLPNINVVKSTKLDSRSILFLKTFLPDSLVDCRQLQEGGTLPNIDGYLDVLCPDGRAREKISVQVKHLTYPEKNGKVYYEIPMSIYAYAERHKGELVLFIACDYDSRIFYWRNIDTAAIEEFKNKSDRIRTKARYYFKDNEKCGEKNVEATIEFWRQLYKQKMESIKDDKYLADQFASRQKMYFDAVSSELHGVRDSHIPRHQVDEIVQWISKDLVRDEGNICLLVGDAGVGKSAVLKDLIAILSENGVKYLCVKSDAIDDNGNPVSLSNMQDTLAYYSMEADKVILIIDQIDALSQSLTNDRTHLNMMMAVLSSLNNWPNVRAVVSCRKYDLEYDSVLTSLKNKSTIVEIGELTEKEVTIALNKLEEGLDKKIDRVTAKMLRTIQMLDSFSILFRRNKSKINFNNQIELYDALWNTVICDSSPRDDVERREHLMYKIVETIQIAGTLNPQFIPDSSQKGAFKYLASNGLIRRDGSAVSFFHQSFYEYTLARHYSETGSLFSADLKKEIQGLEIRSTVKAVLDFKRGHDTAKFVDEARSILKDPDIRLHLKLLTLSVLAFVNNPSRAEKALVTDVCQKDGRLLVYFLRGVNSPDWFQTIRKMLNGIIPELKKDDEQFFPIISCLSRYVFDNPEAVYGMINQIQDRESRLYAVAYIVREHNDYSQPCVLKAYIETKPENAFYIDHLLLDAIQSNLKFALDETGALLLNYFFPVSGRSNSLNGGSLTAILCPKLYEEYPKDMLELLHRCICETVRKTAQSGFYGYSTTEAFNGWGIKDHTEKLLKMYEDLLVRYSSDETMVRPFILELLSLNNATTLSMAFASMAAAPELYGDLIRLLLGNNAMVGAYLRGEVEFFFLKMLRAWYDTLNENEAGRYQQFLLSYKSELDFKYDARRRWSPYLCSHLWRDKWVLICNTLPEDRMIPEMKKCFQELLRRFGGKLMIERQDHSVRVLYASDGVVDGEIYAKWPISNWLSSFLKLDESKWRKGRVPVSLDQHAEAFKKCVSSLPEKFYDFVFSINSRTDIPDRYKVAGLEGLLVGGISPYALWILSKRYITEEFAKENYHTFSEIAEYYVKEENEYIDDVMSLCKALVVSPFSEKSSLFSEEGDKRDMSRRATDMLTKAVNSYQGCAAKLLVRMCAIPSRRPMVYSFFIDNSIFLHECVRLIPLHYLNVAAYFDEALYFPLMKSLLSGMGPEALCVQVNTIQWCFYYKNEIVCDYVDRIESDPLTHELLVQIYFYGIKGTPASKECEKRLEKILSLDNEETIAKLIEAAMMAYEHAEYQDLSKKILEHYASDNREKIVNAYCMHCASLPTEAFNWYCSIVPVYAGKKYQQTHFELSYVKKCISTNPILCYKFISFQRYFETEDASLLDDEIVEVLLEIYKKLRQEEDADAMNEMLDLFDEYVYRDNRVMKAAVALLS